ncbi:hypothetical protein A2U01_0108752, partial [Trifolium medium]|nr:hypothetical protein [Trifolium medium]
MKVMSLWHEWDAVQDAYSSGRQQAQHMHASWQTPPQGKLKCNVDAGLHEAARKTS